MSVGYVKTRMSRSVRAAVICAVALSPAFVFAPMAHAQTNAESASTLHAKVLYVTRLSHRDRVEDDKVKSYLETRGMTVTMVDEAAPVSAARGENLVIISSVVSARDMVGTAYRDVNVPLVTWESDLFDSLRFTGQKKGEDFGEIEKEHYINVVNAPSPLAGGVPAGKGWVYPRDDQMGWGRPAPGATVIATVPGEPTHAVVFAYEKGATMDDDFIAPARRVALFLGNRSFEKLSTQGQALFDAAIDWAVAQPVLPLPRVINVVKAARGAGTSGASGASGALEASGESEVLETSAVEGKAAGADHSSVP